MLAKLPALAGGIEIAKTTLSQFSQEEKYVG